MLRDNNQVFDQHPVTNLRIGTLRGLRLEKRGRGTTLGLAGNAATVQSRLSPAFVEPRGGSTCTVSPRRTGLGGNSTASGKWRSKTSPKERLFAVPVIRGQVRLLARGQADWPGLSGR